MRLAIADPPYPPNFLAGGHEFNTRADRWYGSKPSRTAGVPGADTHMDAKAWNDPARHRQLMADLTAEFDGWAIATTPDAVAMVYPPLPRGVKLLAWTKTTALPTGHRIGSTWEAVILYPPKGRRKAAGQRQAKDVLRCAPAARGFIGAKPAAWTHWVLDALGYAPEDDTVTDLFPGSGSVLAAVSTYPSTPETAQEEESVPA